MSWLGRLFGTADPRDALLPLYQGIVAEGRDPHWYRAGVPDTVDGRFDVIAAVLALVLLRLEEEGEAARQPSALLTEWFVADMDRNLREIGIGDYVVGKHVGRMMGALAGRLAALRDAIAAGDGLARPVRRNVFREAPPSEPAVAAVAARLERLRAALAETRAEALLAGGMPKP